MITQKFIARQLGVSASLVSRALCGTAKNIGASDATIRRIRETARELGYAPNAAALTLRGASSKTIGVVIRDFDDPFLGRMTGELQSLARENGYSLLLTGFDAAANEPCDSASLLRYRLDALIVCGSDICAPWINLFADREIPVVQIGSDRDCSGVARVEMDEQCGIQLLVDHIIGLGHRFIGCIGTAAGPHHRRRKNLELALDGKGITAERRLMVSVPEGKNAGIRAMNELLARAGKMLPTVVVAADDCMAQEALRATHDAGLAVPRDLSLTGIDDIPAAEMTIPALTTVRAPIGRMVRTAFELAFCDSGGNSARTVRFEPELIIRESCRGPNPASARE